MRLPAQLIAISLAVLVAAGCRHTTLLGGLSGCETDSDCSPPSTICTADGRCAAGCGTDPSGCVGGAVCDRATGSCVGGALDRPCKSDGECAPPDFVCKPATGRCVAGCNIDPDVCYGGWICKFTTGRCCDPARPDCRPSVASGGCNGDPDCAAQAGTICQVGACLPGCQQRGCQSPMTCAAGGHCGPPSGACSRDGDCDVGSYCSSSGACLVLPAGGASPCAGGTVDRTSCNLLRSVAEWRACVGTPGPVTCPYCVDGSCLRPGLCQSAADCHRGDTCSGGLCRPALPPCVTFEVTAAVVGGGYAAGRELCVRDEVTSVSDSFDGDIELRLGGPGLPASIMPLHQAAGVGRPVVGTTITVHGVVRWDEWHRHWELHPVDWWSL